MKGRKAYDVSMKFVIMWIILPLFAGVLIVLIVVAPTASALGSKGYSDELCHLNAGFRHWAPVKMAVPLAMCHEKSITIDAYNWKVCDPDGKKGWKNNKDVKRCAEQQIFNLMSRCWYMYGESTWNMALLPSAPGTGYDCFKFQIRDLSGAITEETLTNFMMEQKFDNGKSYCSYIANNDLGWGKPRPVCGNKDNIYWDGAAFKAQEIGIILFSDKLGVIGQDQILIKK